MKIAKSRSYADNGRQVGPGAGIDAATYFERARAFIASRGNVGFVVRGVDGQKGSAMVNQPATEAQWLAWLGYLDSLGVPTKFMRSNGEATVPAEWPEDFDGACGMSDRRGRIAVKPRLADDFDRKATVDRVMHRFSAWGGKPKRKDHPGRTSEWLAEYGRAPLTVSDAFKSHIRGESK